MRDIALLFSGQGSQYIGMSKKLYENLSIVRETFDEASETIGLDLKKLCFESTIDELTKTENTQVAIVTVSVAQYRAFIEQVGREPKYLAGHSLGELSALACAGAINFRDVICLARKRGQFMMEAAEHHPGGMVAISGVDKDSIKYMCEEMSQNGQIATISNYNSKEQIVVSGHKELIIKIRDKVEKKGFKAKVLIVSGAFHSPLMQSSSDKFKQELMKYEYNDFKYPVISNVTGLPYRGYKDIVDNLSLQIINPVQWINTMKYIYSKNIGIVIELGAKNVLKKLATQNIETIEAYSYDNEDDRKQIIDNYSNAGIINGFFSKCLASIVCTKNSNFDNEEYEKGVINNYKIIEQIETDINKKGEFSIKEKLEVLNLVYTIFSTKKVSIEEQIERFKEIFDYIDKEIIFDEFIAQKYANKNDLAMSY